LAFSVYQHVADQSCCSTCRQARYASNYHERNWCKLFILRRT